MMVVVVVMIKANSGDYDGGDDGDGMVITTIMVVVA